MRTQEFDEGARFSVLDGFQREGGGELGVLLHLGGERAGNLGSWDEQQFTELLDTDIGTAVDDGIGDEALFDDGGLGVDLVGDSEEVKELGEVDAAGAGD